MAALSAFLRSVRTPVYSGVGFWCPGCESAHIVPIAGLEPWQFDGNVEAPTITPSIKNMKPIPDTDPVQHTTECHVNVTKGMLQFHSDCAHPLAGQTVPMAPWPDNYSDGSRE